MGVCKRLLEQNEEAWQERKEANMEQTEEVWEERKNLRVKLEFQRERFRLHREREDWLRKKDREATVTLRDAVTKHFEIAGCKEWYVTDAALRRALRERL